MTTIECMELQYPLPHLKKERIHQNTKRALYVSAWPYGKLTQALEGAIGCRKRYND